MQIRTRLGNIDLELYPVLAPITVTNFLRYVDTGKFNGATFYRTVRLDNQKPSDATIQVIQGGLFKPASGGSGDEPERYPPIAHETTQATGLTHIDGTISMGRAEPGTASSEFFICIGDNAALDFGGKRNPDGQGFAAFGRVVRGMQVVHEIHVRASATPLPKDMQIMQRQILEQPVLITSIQRLSGATPLAAKP